MSTASGLVLLAITKVILWLLMLSLEKIYGTTKQAQEFGELQRSPIC